MKMMFNLSIFVIFIWLSSKTDKMSWTSTVIVLVCPICLWNPAHHFSITDSLIVCNIRKDITVLKNNANVLTYYVTDANLLTHHKRKFVSLTICFRVLLKCTYKTASKTQPKRIIFLAYLRIWCRLLEVR